MKCRIAARIALGVWLVCGLSGATLATDQFDGVRTFIRAELKKQQLPSLAIAVSRHGQIVWEEGFGFSNPQKKTPATPHTVYRVCSVSKVFTATAVMILVEQGRLDLDRPVNDYLSDAKLVARVGRTEDATIRRLANHTSGLPMHEQIFYEGERYRQVPSDRMDDQIARYGNIVWAPGKRPRYSNLAFGILSHVVSRQSGVSFTRFMRKEVFNPLGMTRSSVRLSEDLRKLAAVGHVDGQPVPVVTNATAGAGEVWCSAHDLVRFGMFHLKDGLSDQRAILSDASLDEMKVTTSRVPGSDFGVGWGTDSNYRGTGYQAVGHHGGNVGWHSLLLLIPSEDIAIAVLVNANGNILDPVSDQVLSVLLPDFGKRRAAHLKAKASATNKKTSGSKPQMIAEAIGKWSGKLKTFERDIPITISFEETGATLVKLGDQPETEFINPKFRGKSMTADLKADIDSADTRRLRPGILEVDLTFRGDVLNGVIYANSLYGNPELGGYRLNHWVELKRRKP